MSYQAIFTLFSTRTTTKQIPWEETAHVDECFFQAICFYFQPPNTQRNVASFRIKFPPPPHRHSYSLCDPPTFPFVRTSLCPAAEVWNGSFLIPEHLVSKGTGRVIWVRFAVGTTVNCWKAHRGLISQLNGATGALSRARHINTGAGTRDLKRNTCGENVAQTNKQTRPCVWWHTTPDMRYIAPLEHSSRATATVGGGGKNLRVKQLLLDGRVNFCSGAASISDEHSWARLRIHASWIRFIGISTRACRSGCRCPQCTTC